MAYSYDISKPNTTLKEDSFFSTQPRSPDALYNYPSTKSFKISKSTKSLHTSGSELNTNPNNSNQFANDRTNKKSPEKFPGAMKQNGSRAQSSRQLSAQTQFSDEESDYSDSFISESPDIRKKDHGEHTKTTIVNYGMLESEAVWMQLRQQNPNVDLDINVIDMDNQFGVVTDNNQKLPKIWSRMWGNPGKQPKKPAKPFTIPFIGKKTGQKKVPKRKDRQANLKDSETSRRVLSAHQIKIKDLRCRIESMKAEMKDVNDENKMLKRLQRKQEKALVEYNNQESELPKLLQRHNNEMVTLREHLRKTRDKHAQTERTLRSMQDQLHNSQQSLLKYKTLAEEKRLPERDELYQKAIFTENECQVKQRKIEELERYIDNLTKNHKHQLSLEIQKQKDSQKQIDLLQDSFSSLQLAHKEKEKELEIRNIYSHRIARPPHKLPSSYNSSPIMNSSTIDEADKRGNLSQDMTPRARAQEYANKIRNDEFRRRDRAKRKVKPDTTEKPDYPLAPFPGSLRRHSAEHNYLDDLENDRVVRVESKRHEEELRRMEMKREEEEWMELKRQEDDVKRLHEEQQRAEEIHRLEEKRKEEERRARKDREIAEQRRQASEWEAQMNEVKLQREEKERVDNEQKRRDEAKRFEDERKQMEQQRKEEERLEKERLTAEKELRDERRRIDSEPHMRDAWKQKDMLLAKMKMIDDHRMEEVDMGGAGEGSDTSPSSKKNYHFTSITENLHHGRPSHDHPADKNGFFDDDHDTGYMPSFDLTFNNSKKTEPKGKKKGKLMEELFGASQGSPEKTAQNGYVPSLGGPTKKTRNFWDDNNNSALTHPSQKPSNVGPQERSTIVAGGNMVLDSDEALLPRRFKQKNVFEAPVLTTANTFDDDIDEVIL